MGQLLFSIALSLFWSCKEQPVLSIESPSGKVEVRLNEEAGKLRYGLTWEGQTMIAPSDISIFPDRQVNVLRTSTQEVNETWNPIWGQFSEVANHYNELTAELDYEGIPATLFVRSYDQGVAFRFEVNEIPEGSEPSYLVEYGLSWSTQLYMPAGEKEPVGPITIGSLPDQGQKKLKWHVPLVVETTNTKYLSILESDLISAPGFELINVSYDKQRGNLIASNSFASEENKLSTPWRVILLEEKLGDLLTNTVALNVATPNQIKDPSWIKPGKTVWDWRVHGYTAADGFTYGVDTESYLRFIDFASAYGIEYFMIDANWFTDVTPGSFEVSESLDLEKVTNYADEKGVSLLLYYDRLKGHFGDEALFPYFQSLGMQGIKYGFMRENISFTREAIRRSAQNHLLIDFHDSPVPLTGASRTYPNAITREYCHAQQDSRKAFTPEAFIKMALINAIQGPLDMNNGIFDISGVNVGARQKGPIKLNSLFTTAAAEAARTLIIFSGLVCIPDAPEAYVAKSDLFEFIQKLPVGKWDESRVLHAKMGEYITTARRHKKDWFIGSVHAKGGTLAINLDFLEEGQDYVVTYYEDTELTDSKTNPEAYQVRKGLVRKGDIINAKMAVGGGHCMWIRLED